MQVPRELRNEINRAVSGYRPSIRARGQDVLVEFGSGEVLDHARKLAEALGHKAINFRSSEYEDLDEAIEDYGCGSCGFGAIVVLKGILK